MRVYPAVDIKDGRCVRLVQGDYDRVLQFADDPVAVARGWETSGADWLHVVDLDGARSGVRRNEAVINAIRAAVTMKMQIGGGIRSIETIEALLEAGIDRVVLGTAALNDPLLVLQALKRWPTHIAISLDTRDGLVTADGWLTTSKQTPSEVLMRLAELGAGVFIYTDISRDGMLGGPNMEALAELVRQAHGADCQLIAAGGVSSIEDIRKLAALGVDGAIVGRALYSGDVDLAAALVTAKEGTPQ